MSIFKCKMCGGNIDVTDGATVVECEYCGTKQTVPDVNDEKKLNLYNRANRLRMNSEFDKAGAIYEQIIAEFPEEAEAYWGLCLCNYGIEYVDDPATGAKIPTVHRASFEKLRKDENYELALEYADLGARVVYQEQAKEIDRIMGEILSISSSEKPYDIFICYKETDTSGGRTPDSVIAQDIYDELTKKGYKVFFSRITLEDKLGQQYEPYIFAALNSAKVMLTIGTDYEYFNAVWVKNEWSRFLKLMAKDKSKMLIPCFKDMDAYDMPDEFKGLQSQDMGKLGFMQDLLRGIDKIFGRERRTESSSSQGNMSVEPLLKRVFVLLSNGEWDAADACCERVLDLDLENGRAYLGKLMADLKIHTEDELKDLAEPFDDSKYYAKACCLDAELAEKLKADNDYIRERNETARKQAIYDEGIKLAGISKSESEFKDAAAEFDKIKGFKDADMLAKQCREKAEICRKNSVYASAKSKMTGEKAASYEEAIGIFKTISGWKDADEQIYTCQKKIEEIKAKEEADRLESERKAEERRIAEEKAAKKRKKAFAITTPIVCACIAFVIVLNSVIIPKQKFNKAMGLIDSGDYDSAYALLEEIGNNEAIASSKYDRIITLIDSGDYDSAYALLEEIGNNEAIASSKYDRAITLIDSGDYEPAYLLLNGLEYKDSDEKVNQILNEHPNYKIKFAAIGEIVTFGAYEQDNNMSNGKEDIEWQVLAKEDNKILVTSKYALDCQQYNTSYTDVTWENCSLRKWMNGTFLNNAFSAEEQAQIQNTTVSADKNPKYSTNPENATTDKVFLLSINEAEKYLTNDEARKCAPTAYAKAQGAYTSDSYKTASGEATCRWWLRSPGDVQRSAAYVVYDGSIRYCGYLVDFDYFCVRPALWINLNS